MPTSSCHLPFPKNARLSQRFAGLSQRFAVRRAFGSQKAEKRLEISRNFSRQGYASDFRHMAKLSDNALMACGDVRRSQQAPQCFEALVLLGVRGICLICT